MPQAVIVHAAVATFPHALMSCALQSCMSSVVAICMSALHFNLGRPVAEVSADELHEAHKSELGIDIRHRANRQIDRIRLVRKDPPQEATAAQ